MKKPINFIEKELTHAFRHIGKPDFSISIPNACHECVDRHNEINTTRELTIEDIEKSCYSSFFYSNEIFIYLIPRLLIKVMNKEKSDYSSFPTGFLQELRNEDHKIQFLTYDRSKLLSINHALEFIVNLYFMEDYSSWDFEEEKLILFGDKKEWHKEATLTLEFWQNLLA